MPGPFLFAWAGGTITEQTTLVTTGTTHGVDYETAALVGDTVAGGSQLINIAVTSRLIEGSLYELAGPGFTAGTLFFYDASILSGLPNSVNLFATATGGGTSGTFVTRQAVPVGVALGTLTAGAAAVAIDGGGLPAGIYGVHGTGIGETDIPLATTEGTSFAEGGGVMIVGSCCLDYDGTGGGALMIRAAQPHTTTDTDEFGQPTSITTYTVVTQEVRATASGVFPLQLTGFPDTDSALVTGVPGDALATLDPGLVYNIAGNGIPLGATFIAPAGGTELTLDLGATAADLGALLTITGPRTPNAPFDPAVHNRVDEDVLSVDISQEEGGLATLTIDIKNPNIGLLALGRNLWCWLSWDQNWPNPTADLVPLFNGRLIGVPKLAAGEVVQLQFLARPDDMAAQKAALAEALQVLPYYDPVWLAANVTADTALETRSLLWHIDRTTLTLSTSDIIAGEDGIIDIGEDVSIYEKFSLSYGEPPLVATTISGTVSWQQQAEGTFDISQLLISAFYDSGSGYSRAFAKDAWENGGGGIIQCLCGDGMKSEWPRPGATIGGGWAVTNRIGPDGTPLSYIIDASWLDTATYDLKFTARPQPDEGETSPPQVYLLIGAIGEYTARFPINAYKIRLTVEYRADRRRTETVQAVVTAGMQRELSDPSEHDRESISLTSQFVDQGVDPEGALPIGNVAYRSYFQTGRGAASFEYLLLAARAKMRARARAVDISFCIPWAAALPITLRHSVRYTDRRVPGGVAIGKVKSYRLTAGTAGMLGEFTIGCTIGTADAITPQAGVNSYVADGYVNPGWQIVTGTQTPTTTGDIAWQSLDNFVIRDDGLDLTNLTLQNAVNECVVVNGLETQLAVLHRYQHAFAETSGDPIAAIKATPTRVTLDLKPLQGSEFHTTFTPALTPLSLPKTIDLAAPAPGI